MCACVRNDMGLMIINKQGIVSILGSDSDKPVANSLRRTLSADMSSKKWLSENGFLSTMKKIASSREFSISKTSSSSEDEGKDGVGENESMSGFDVWASIQKDKNKNTEFITWSSILSQKVEKDPNDKLFPPPYVHPLVKSSASSLSEKSLKICTESLGSETGSDGFSSYPPSEIGDTKEDREEHSGNIQDQQEQQQKQEEKAPVQHEPTRALKYSPYLRGKKLSQRSFPPPIPSLSRPDGSSMYMKTRRDNGRLVLEALSVPPNNNLCSQRQYGRLVLTFASSIDGEQDEQKNPERSQGKEGEKETDKEKMGFVMEKTPNFSCHLMSFHRLALVVNKSIGLGYRSRTWPKRFDELVQLRREKVDNEDEGVLAVEKAKQTTSLAQSLPPRLPPTATAASFNTYEYYWRSKIASKGSLPNHAYGKNNSSTFNKVVLTKNRMGDEQQQQFEVLTRNKGQRGGDELAPFLLKGCKEQKKSLLFRESYCIATS